ncbi:SDR family oxidoreductase [Agromyces sp. NPDC056523]|uniref:SDR family oxidoreductase n=1 Tax=Agromyces sp. NPDC056523 TaxID=3345850 RepID=UPI00366E1F5C
MRIAVAGATGNVGRHVIESATARGHDILTLTRRAGYDLEKGTGLAGALDGVDAVIDVANVTTTSTRRSREFFTAVSSHLLAAERDAGVGHHVALSIVGIDGVDAAYDAGKLAQEALVTRGDVPFTLQRATQFHEFAEQIVRQLSLGRLTLVPKGLARPVAARDVGARLVELAEAGPAGRVRDLTGPREERLADMVRRMIAFDGVKRRVVEFPLPGRFGRATASGQLRGGADAQRGTIDFDAWLRSPDHTALRAGAGAATSA